MTYEIKQNICLKVPVQRRGFIEILKVLFKYSDANKLYRMYVFFGTNLSTICLFGLRSIGPST